ncbi:hypothetical protein DE146DRAFT_277847 [Phaeosphaeria sp. MPI-PUGE-AT-0046c]|nr:hypothetical protein DE146DRAFT_277847 [Phaeosphaeria sp. MPI-PUGE-AT-0046c]
MNIYHSCAALLLCFANLIKSQQHPLISPPLPILRNATISDADDIASVVIAAFSPTPAWQYIYQFHATRPKEHHRCVRYGVMQALTSPEYTVQVIEAPPGSELSVAAAALWQQSIEVGVYGMFATRLAKECAHRDMNLTRANYMNDKSTDVLRKYVEEPFGQDQLYLDMLGVHPDYQLHGAGTRLVAQGVERGGKAGVNVTLVALPTSEGFYAHIGFTSYKNFTIGSVDGDREFGYDVMAYDFGRE